jgi:ketosteroid isomerase-like protein
MSQENVEVVRRWAKVVGELAERARETMGRKSAAIDFPEVPALFQEFWHPHAVYDVSGRLDGGIYHAPEGVNQATRDWLAAWEDFEIEFKEFISAGERVVVVQDFRATAEDGMQVVMRDFCTVYTVRHGQFVDYREYLARADALEAAGLRE